MPVAWILIFVIIIILSVYRDILVHDILSVCRDKFYIVVHCLSVCRDRFYIHVVVHDTLSVRL